MNIYWDPPPFLHDALDAESASVLFSGGATGSVFLIDRIAHESLYAEKSVLLRFLRMMNLIIAHGLLSFFHGENLMIAHTGKGRFSSLSELQLRMRVMVRFRFFGMIIL